MMNTLFWTMLFLLAMIVSNHASSQTPVVVTADDEVSQQTFEADNETSDREEILNFACHY